MEHLFIFMMLSVKWKTNLIWILSTNYKNSDSQLSKFLTNLLFGTFTFPACPSAPKDFKVAEVTRRHVHLMWEVPEHDGGSPVTHYQIEKREVSRKTWAKVRLSLSLVLELSKNLHDWTITASSVGAFWMSFYVWINECKNKSKVSSNQI